MRVSLKTRGPIHRACHGSPLNCVYSSTRRLPMQLSHSLGRYCILLSLVSAIFSTTHSLCSFCFSLISSFQCWGSTWGSHLETALAATYHWVTALRRICKTTMPLMAEPVLETAYCKGTLGHGVLITVRVGVSPGSTAVSSAVTRPHHCLPEPLSEKIQTVRHMINDLGA